MRNSLTEFLTLELYKWHCFLYASLSDSLQVLRQVHSICRLIPLSLRRFKENQGLEVLGFTVTVFKGTYLSSIWHVRIEVVNKRVEVKIVNIGKSVGYILIKISKINLLIGRQENVTLLTVGFRKSISTHTVLWSEIYVSSKYGQIIRFDDALVLIKLRMWPELWVGREPCWHKLNVFNNLRKWRALESFNSSTRILKSPTIFRSTLDEMWNSSKDLNSVKNVDMDDDGGRYTTKSLKELFFEVITEPMHSNMEKTGVDTIVWWTDSS